MPQLEIEQKLALSFSSMEKVFKALAPETGVQNKHFRRAYFDTEDLALHSRKTALRIQPLDEGGYEQMVKIARPADGASLIRTESQYKIDTDRPNTTVISDISVCAAFEGINAGQLRHIFTSEVNRRFFDITGDAGCVEIAFDLGEIRLAPEYGDAHDNICEIELELKQGAPAILDLLTARIKEIADDAEISMISKAGRGFSLYRKAVEL